MKNKGKKEENNKTENDKRKKQVSQDATINFSSIVTYVFLLQKYKAQKQKFIKNYQENKKQCSAKNHKGGKDTK